MNIPKIHKQAYISKLQDKLAFIEFDTDSIGFIPTFSRDTGLVWLNNECAINLVRQKCFRIKDDIFMQYEAVINVKDASGLDISSNHI